MTHDQKKWLLIALLLSIFFIHAPLVWFFMHHHFDSAAENLTAQDEKKNAVMIDLTPRIQTLPKRIVDIAKPDTEQVPDKASAQALYNSKVKEETVSPHFSKQNKQLGTPPQVTKKSKTVVAQKTTTTPTPPKKEPVQQNPVAKTKTLDLKQQLAELKKENDVKETEKFSKLYGKTSTPTAPTLKTRIGSPDGGNTDEFLPDYKVGDRTFLNTLANPHIFYFVELRQKFRFTFSPASVLRGHLNEISRGKLEVVWGLSVDSSGNLKDLILLRSSGMSDYDKEAKRTITASAPFSKPPFNLLDKNGQLNMAWTFVVYL